MAFAFPTFRQPALVTYGTGSLKSLASSQDWDGTVLFMSGSTAVDGYVRQAWSRNGPSLDGLRVVVKPPGEPSWQSITEAASELRQAMPTRLMAIGGGAVLDWARLSWLAAVDALDSSGRVNDRWHGPRREVEVVLVPTTCGSGAEAAAIAVFSHENRKLPVVSPALLADQVVLDSRFLASVPASTLASSVADALSHAIEAWMSIVPGRLPRQAAVSCLRLILSDGPAYDRSATLMDAGFLGGVAAAHCSVGVVHAFAHTISRHGLGHGHANALALVPGVRRLMALPAGGDLLQQLGLSASALEGQIAMLIAPALEHPASRRAVAILDTPADRKALIDAMMTDPCMRTCPLSLTSLDVEALLDEVRDGAMQQC